MEIVKTIFNVPGACFYTKLKLQLRKKFTQKIRKPDKNWARMGGVGQLAVTKNPEGCSGRGAAKWFYPILI